MAGVVQPRRSGYALIWVIVTTAIIAALIAAAAPSLAVMDQRARAVRAAESLKAIADGTILFGTTMRNYPGRISMLTTAITTSDRNTCNRAITGGNVADWPTNAPYATSYLPANGLWTDIGRIRDSIPFRRFPTLRTPIYAEIPGVDAADAAMLDLVVDNGSGDTVTFATPVNDTTTVRYRLVSSGVIINNRC